MALSYQYTYLILGLAFLIIWLILFIWRKDVREKMLVLSLILGAAGIITEFTYYGDWWNPLTITNTKVGIEDFLFGFTAGGIAAVLYEEIFKKRIRFGKKEKEFTKKKDFRIFSFIALTLILFHGCVYLLKFNTFSSTILACIIPTIIIYAKRRDLVPASIFSAILLPIVAFGTYTLVELITPGWIEEFWIFKNTPAWIILNVPIDDLIWYVFIGAYIGPLYEYWQQKKLINLRKSK